MLACYSLIVLVHQSDTNESSTKCIFTATLIYLIHEQQSTYDIIVSDVQLESERTT